MVRDLSLQEEICVIVGVLELLWKLISQEKSCHYQSWNSPARGSSFSQSTYDPHPSFHTLKPSASAIICFHTLYNLLVDWFYRVGSCLHQNHINAPGLRQAVTIILPLPTGWCPSNPEFFNLLAPSRVGYTLSFPFCSAWSVKALQDCALASAVSSFATLQIIVIIMMIIIASL